MTVELPDDLVRRAEARAAELGISLIEFIVQALEEAFDRDESERGLGSAGRL